MIFPEVKRLYKYFSYNTNSLSTLITKKFWASKPEAFNDPFDCGIKLLHEMDSKSALIFMRDYLQYDTNIKQINPTNISDIELVEASLNNINSVNLNENVLKKSAEVVSDMFAKLLQNFGVISLSEINDNILMWSHYADQHYGFCLELKRSKNNSLGSHRTFPVRYSSKTPLLSAAALVGGTKGEKKEIRRSLIMTKAQDWYYEREWRYAIEHKGNRAIKLNSKMESVIFGLRMQSNHRKTVYDILKKDKSLNFKEVRKKQNSFGLEIIDMNRLDI